MTSDGAETQGDHRVETARQLYEALGTFDKARIREILSPDFRADLVAGMPLGLGGRQDGCEAMIKNVWSKAASVFIIKAVPDTYIPTEDGALLVFGKYAGSVRETGKRFEAVFAHLFGFESGRINTLRQVTDTEIWSQALAA